MSFGTQSSGGSTGSSSSPISAEQRISTFQSLMDPTYHQYSMFGNGIGPERAGLNLGSDVPQASDFQTLANGDYAALQKSMTDSAMIPVNQAWDRRYGDLKQEMANRGIWNSGALPQAASREYATNVLPMAQKAGAEATQVVTAMKAADLEKQWNAKWRRPEFLASVYNGTNGQVSTGSGSNNSGGWNFSI